MIYCIKGFRHVNEQSAPSDQDPREKREMRGGEGSKVITVIKVHLAYKDHKEREVNWDIQGTKVRKERWVIEELLVHKVLLDQLD